VSDGGKPLIGYKMHGVPCAACALPMAVLWVFKDRLEVWHLDTEERCSMGYYTPADPVVPDKKPDRRKIPRRYVKCRHCGIRFAQPKQSEEVLCKSCRNQQELFTHDEISGLEAS
jgi:hypothetical protein